MNNLPEVKKKRGGGVGNVVELLKTFKAHL